MIYYTNRNKDVSLFCQKQVYQFYFITGKSNFIFDFFVESMFGEDNLQF